MAEGKILGWGLSNAPLDYLRRAHAACPLAAIENQYSMVWRGPEREAFGLCGQLHIAFVAYSPLGNGFLTGRYTQQTTYGEGDFRSFMGRFSPDVMARNRALLDLVADVAAQKGATCAQVVLAWELAKRPFVIPIPGTTSRQRLEENLGAAQLSFTAQELAALAGIVVDETHF